MLPIDIVYSDIVYPCIPVHNGSRESGQLVTDTSVLWPGNLHI